MRNSAINHATIYAVIYDAAVVRKSTAIAQRGICDFIACVQMLPMIILNTWV